MEPLRRFDRAALWEGHFAYYREEGLGPWQRQEVPDGATSFGFALQAAHFAHGMSLPDRPLEIWELGAGTGAFAARFLRALARIQGRPEPRCRYVLTDLSARTVEAACHRPDLRPAIDAGLLIPATLDVLAERAPMALDGQPIPTCPDFVIGTYFACILPTTWVRLRAGRWEEAWVVEGPRADAEPTWRLVELDERFPEPALPAALRGWAAGVESADVPVSEALARLLLGQLPWFGPDTVLLLSDFGSLAPAGHPSLRHKPLTRYGDSLAQGQALSFLAQVAASGGRGVACTADPTHEVQTIATWPDARDLAPAFRAAWLDRAWGEEQADLQGAARMWAEQGGSQRALRLYQRLFAELGDEPELLVEAGKVALRAGLLTQARALLERALACMGGSGFDVDFDLGRLCMAEGAWEAALVHLGRSAGRDPHPITQVNLCRVHRARGDGPAALTALHAALRLDPEHPAVRQEQALLLGDRP